VVNDKDDFFKQLVNTILNSVGYDPLGLIHQAQVLANPIAITGLTPTVVSQFEVTPVMPTV
jgi:hypothetical protein